MSSNQPAAGVAPGHELSPYVGPRPFTTKDRDIFFGRNQEAIELTSLVKAHPELLLYAQSGAGKTSLLFAQVIPILDTEEDFDVLPPARVRGQESSPIPGGKINNIYMFNALKDLSDDQLSVIERAQFTLAHYLKRRPRPAVAAPSDAAGNGNNESPELRLPRVVIFDQFEEIFTLHPERYKDRQDFFLQVAEALKTDPFLRVVFSMREDYIAEMEPYDDILPQSLRTRFRLERLRKANSVSAVKQPLATERVKTIGRQFADGAAEMLVEKLMLIKVKTASGEKVEVPGEFVDPVQLQVVCQTLWEKLPPDKAIITKEDIDQYANVDEALSDFYETSVRKAVTVANTAIQAGRIAMSGDPLTITEGAVRGWFEQKLITREGKRNMVFREAHSTAGLSNLVVDELDNQHVVRVEMRAGEPWYELSHDRFIPPIRESNRRFLLQQPLARRKAQELEERAEAWLKSRRSQRLLLNRGELLDAQNWMRTEAAAIGYSETLFSLIGASEAAIEHEDNKQQQLLTEALGAQALAQQQRARQMKFGLVIVSVLLLCTLGSTAFAIKWGIQANTAQATAWKYYNRAQSNLLAANDAKELAQQQKSNADRQRERAEDAAGKLAIEKKRAEDVADELKIANAKEESQRRQAVDARKQAENAKAFAVSAQKEAENAANDAKSVKLASDAKSQLSTDPELGLRLALLALDFSPTEGAKSSLRQTYQRFNDHSVLKGHTDVVRQAIYSFDGRFIFTASEDKTVKMWDAKTYREVKTFAGHGGGVHALAITADGTRIATEALDDSGKIWNVSDGTSLPLKDLSGPVAALAFSQDGKLLATEATNGSGDAGAAPRIWDVATGAVLKILVGHTGAVSALAFDSKGDRLVTASWDKTARVWDVATGRELLKLEGHTAPLACVAFSPKGTLVATGSYDGTARVWDVVTGKQMAILKGHTGVVHGIAFNPRGDLILTSGRKVRSTVEGSDNEIPLPNGMLADDEAPDDNTLRLYSLDGLEQQRFIGHTGDINSATFSSDGEKIVSASEDGTARVWDTNTGKTLLEFRTPGGLGQNSVVLSPDDKLLLTAGTDKTVQVWRVDSLNGKAQSSGQRGAVLNARFADNDSVITSGVDGVRLSDSTTGKSRPIGVEFPAASVVYGAALSPDGRFVVTASKSRDPRDTIARIWAVSDAKRPLLQLTGHKGAVTRVSYSPKGTYVCTITRDGTANVWRAADGILLRTFAVNGSTIITVTDAAFSVDERYFATAYRNGNIRTWDVLTGNQIALIDEHVGAVNTIAFNSEADLPMIVSSGSDATARVCVVNGKCMYTLRGNSGSVTSAAFSRDGRLIVTVGVDRRTRVWETATGNLINELRGYPESLRSAAFNSDGTELVVGGQNGTIFVSECAVCRPFDQVKELASAMHPRVLTPEEKDQFLVFR